MQTSEQQSFWDKESSAENYFKGYLQTIAENRWTEMLVNAEKADNIRVQGEILEIGGGSQYLSRFICERSDTRVICTDISDQRIQLANQYYQSTPSNLTTMGNVNAQNLPFNNEQFDFIIGDAVLHHIEDLRAGLYEINRCLKPNGHAVFIREPVIGIDLPIKRVIKKLITSSYSIDKFEFIKANRFEFDKYITQWKEEFYRAGFIPRVHKGWYFKTFKNVLFSRAPSLFTCLVTFSLKKDSQIKLF